VGRSPGKVWVGIDVGKTHHWVCVVDTDGHMLLSTKVANDEADIAAVIANVSGWADQVVWAVDIIAAPSAPLLALSAGAGQSVRYASGRVVATMSTAYTGEARPMPKTPT
jgi:predicted RNase H-like nuclease (RuvC/YqgF family)